MKRLTQTLPVFLAAALQLMPLVRNLFINPATGSSFAFILRWGIGSVATVGAFDACSGATGLPLTSTNHIYGTSGVYMSNSITLAIQGNQAAASDYIILSTTSGALAVGPLYDGQTTSNGCLPQGLTFKCLMPAGKSTIGGYLYGTPSNTVTALTSNITLTAYDIASGSGAYPTNISITILPAPAGTAPVITNQPVSLTNNVSSNATFTVTAGTAPLKYQWYFNTNTALPNATNTSLTLTNLQLTNAGNYRVIITNASGSVTSSFATLTVWQPPVITNTPLGFTNVAGGSGSLGITAGGFPALAYQWRITTNLITTTLASGTNASLSFTNLRACQAGAYTVILTNSAGSVTSAIANVAVTNPLPPVVGGSVQGNKQFQFTFTPIAGLTNTVLTNGLLFGGNWGVFTNYPPTATPTPITISNNPSAPSLFYRLLVVP